MSRLFQIHEDDLAELERIVPDLVRRVMEHPNYGNRERTQIRRVQDIIRDVRWDYGPHTNVSEVPSDDTPSGDGPQTPAT